MYLIEYELIDGKIPSFIVDGGYWILNDSMLGFSNKEISKNYRYFYELLLRSIDIYNTHGFTDKNENELTYNEVIEMTYNWWQDNISILTESQVLKARLMELGKVRWLKEVSGINWTDNNGNTFEVNTNRSSQRAWTSVHETAINGTRPNDSTVKLPNVGSIIMDNENVINMTEAVSSYVQDCFNYEKVKQDELLSLEGKHNIISYDLITGWPSQDR